MGDLNKGETFAAGETVTAARLHKLIEDATIKTGVVTGTHIAGGAITQDKLATGLTFNSAAFSVPEDNIIIGDANGDGTNLPVGSTLSTSGSLDLADAAVNAVKLADDAVETAKIKDANVTLPKLATQASLTLVGNATGGAASPTAIPIGSGLEVSGGSLRVLTTFVKGVSIGIALPDGEGAALDSSLGGFSSEPLAFIANLVCQTGEAGYAAGDVVELASVCGDPSGDDRTMAFSASMRYSAGTVTVQVRRNSNTPDIFIARRDTGAVFTSPITAANWAVYFTILYT